MESNLSYLTPLTTDSAVELLRQRWHASQPYTTAHDSSTVMVAVNPLREIPGLNGRESWSRYDSNKEQPPHVYSVSAGALERVQQGRRRQAILVSGESGAGKTETTKLLLEHLAKKSAKQASSSIVNRILAANPVLEAFGNASTAANENSSRFGKMLTLRFDGDSRLESAQVKTFLFERSRVMNRSESERNFHVFYQLLAGVARDGPRTKYALGLLQETSPQDFSILNSSLDLDLNPQRDFLEASRTLRALSCLGVSSQERMNLMKTVAAVLHLGNLKFSAIQDGAEISPETRQNASHAARLLGLQDSSQLLESCLCERSVNVRGECILIRNTPSQSAQLRDSLGKELYARAFQWLISYVNNEQDSPSPAATSSICLLDVMGFEALLQGNSLEQLLINFCNEKLQNLFSRNLIFSVQEEYVLEGITSRTVAVDTAREALVFFDHPRQGLWALLDQECFVPGGSDLGFVRKLARSSPPNSICQTGKLLSPHSFLIKHFAGNVEYTAEGMLDKSQGGSCSKAVSALLDEHSALARFFALEEEPSSHHQRTIGIKFRNELETLLQDLDACTDVSWIRCIRPNLTKNPAEFDVQTVKRQLACSGVVPAVALARDGLPNQIKLLDFYAKFACVLSRVDLSKAKYGRTRIYLTNDDLASLQVALQDHRETDASIRIQTNCRRFLTRARFLNFRRAVSNLQSLFRKRRTAVVVDQLIHGEESFLMHVNNQQQQQELSSLSGSSVTTDDNEDEEASQIVPVVVEEEVEDLFRHPDISAIHLVLPLRASSSRHDDDQQKLNELQERFALLLEERIVLEKEQKDKERRLAELEREVLRLRLASTQDEDPIMNAFKQLFCGSSSCFPWKFRQFEDSLKIQNLKARIVKNNQSPSKVMVGGVLMMASSKLRELGFRRYAVLHDWVLDALGMESDCDE